MSIASIKPINISEELSRTKSLEVKELENIVEELNKIVKQALLCKRNTVDFQFKTFDENNIQTIVNLYSKQENVKVELVNKKLIETFTKDLFLVDIKVSW